MSRLSDAEIQAETLSRGGEEMYYGEEVWPSDDELRADSQQREEDEERFDSN